jgi:preprotein translocase subunit Sec63
MDSVQDALNVLGLGLEASADEIHQAYRDLCMVWHPDRFPNESRVRQKAEEKTEANKWRTSRTSGAQSNFVDAHYRQGFAISRFANGELRYKC